MRSPRAAAAPRARFPKDDGFRAVLERRVAAHLAAKGARRTGDAAMRLKTGIILAWFAGSYALLLALGASSPWIAAALVLSLALSTAGVGFSVMHDANHGAYARSRGANRALGLALDVVGGSSYVWRFKHNVQHHTYANVDGLDADVDAGPFLRLAPSQPRRAWHRWQHVYGWALYGALAVKWWLVDDVVDVVRGRVGQSAMRRPRGLELALFVLGKAVFLGWAVVVPALVFRTFWIVPFQLAGAAVLGVVLATVFQLAHAVPDAEFHEVTPGEERRLPAGFAEHQVRATVDFAPSNRLLGWYVGGLNFQVEHHLFPDVCHVHYPAIREIVRATCREHGVPHRTAPTLRAALVSHARFLRELGRAPIEVPAPARA